MKQTDLIGNFLDKKVYHIVSEPGDATRYDYYVAVDHCGFSFMPGRSTFPFPQQLNSYDIKELTEHDIMIMAKEKHCNPFTLKECIRTIEELNI